MLDHRLQPPRLPRQHLPGPRGRVGVDDEGGRVEPEAARGVVGLEGGVAEEIGRGEVEAAVVQPPGERQDQRGRGGGVEAGLEEEGVLLCVFERRVCSVDWDISRCGLEKNWVCMPWHTYRDTTYLGGQQEFPQLPDPVVARAELQRDGHPAL